jgi:hypothetical protein
MQALERENIKPPAIWTINWENCGELTQNKYIDHILKSKEFKKENE